tara:strand:+ start:4028 stop:5101 length:1074 start_codon:yes stop_codon:yes gene_type:complete
MAIIYLMPTSPTYGTALAVVYGVFSFFYRFLYSSIGLHASRKRELISLYSTKQNIVKIQIYINILLAVFFVTVLRNFSDFLWLAALIQFSATVSIILAYCNEVTRFSAKTIIPKRHLYQADSIRVAVEFSVTLMFIFVSQNEVLEERPSFLLIILSLIISLCIRYFSNSKRIFVKRNIAVDNKWLIFLVLSGILFGLDRSIVTLAYDNPQIYISVVAICSPFIGMFSYIFIWLYRGQVSQRTRLTLMLGGYSVVWLIAYLSIALLPRELGDDPKWSYWVSLFSQYYGYIYVYGVMLLVRDFLMQSVFEKDRGNAVFIISLPVLCFFVLILAEVEQTLLLVIPITTYVVTERILNAIK